MANITVNFRVFLSKKWGPKTLNIRTVLSWSWGFWEFRFDSLVLRPEGDIPIFGMPEIGLDNFTQSPANADTSEGSPRGGGILLKIVKTLII